MAIKHLTPRSTEEIQKARELDKNNYKEYDIAVDSSPRRDAKILSLLNTIGKARYAGGIGGGRWRIIWVKTKKYKEDIEFLLKDYIAKGIVEIDDDYLNEAIKHLSGKTSEEILKSLENSNDLEEIFGRGLDLDYEPLIKLAIEKGYKTLHSYSSSSASGRLWGSYNNNKPNATLAILKYDKRLHKKIYNDADFREDILGKAAYMGFIDVVNFILDNFGRYYTKTDLLASTYWGGESLWKNNPKCVEIIKEKMKKSKLHEAIRHLSPKSDDELKNSIKNLDVLEKLEFAQKHNLAWVKEDAEKELKRIINNLSIQSKFQIAKTYDIEWLQKEAKKEFKSKNHELSPTFIELYNYLKIQLGEDFDYDIDYFSETSWNLKMVFSAEKVHFMITQHIRISMPEIKVAKKLGDIYFFTDGSYINTTSKMMSYIKSKVKQLKNK